VTNRLKANVDPSGDQSGELSYCPATDGVTTSSTSDAGSTVISCARSPAGAVRLKAITLPSGDQAGPPSKPAVAVSWVRPVPSTLTVQISVSPPTGSGHTKARRVPSGPHAALDPPSVFGTIARLPPSASIDQMPVIVPPASPRWKAIRVPAAFQAGSRSLTVGVDVIARAPVPFFSTLWMSSMTFPEVQCV
jgi:hypothetical protein